MTDRDWDREQGSLIHQLDHIEMDWELRQEIYADVMRWFDRQRQADRRWALRCKDQEKG